MRTALVLVLLATACCGPSAAASHPLDPAATGAGADDAAPSVPIENFAEVADGLYRGAQPDAAGFAALHDLGVRTVMNFREKHSDRALAEKAGLSVVEIPLHAFLESDPPTDEEVRTFFDTVLDPAKRPVFVHCAYGKDRTGTMCALYRIEVDGWTPQKAFEEMQRYGFHEAYTDLRKFVLGYTPRGFAKR